MGEISQKIISYDRLIESADVLGMWWVFDLYRLALFSTGFRKRLRFAYGKMDGYSRRMDVEFGVCIWGVSLLFMIR